MQQLKNGILKRDQDPALLIHEVLWRFLFGGGYCITNAVIDTKLIGPFSDRLINISRRRAFGNCVR